MQKFKRILAAVCAVVMLVLCCAGCSTPANAMTIDGYTVSTGEYLVNLYNMFYSAYYNSGLYYTAYYNSYTAEQVWAMEQTYGEGDTAITMTLDDYVKQLAKDSLIRQQVIKNLMEEYKITLSDEDKAEIATQMESYDEASFLELGFNAENYEKMMTAYNFEESALFYGLYDEGGTKAVAEADIREYFDTNYLVYKTFTISLVDDEGADLAEDEIAAIEKQMNGYLTSYKNGTDVAEIYKTYLADEAAKEETDDTTDTATTDDTTEEEQTLDYSTLLADSESANADLVKAIQGLKAGEATTVTYSPSDSTKVIAFVVRYEHTDDYKSADEYYEATRESALYNMKGEEFEEMLEEPIKEMGEKVEVNSRAISMCDPKYFLSE